MSLSLVHSTDSQLPTFRTTIAIPITSPHHGQQSKYVPYQKAGLVGSGNLECGNMDPLVNLKITLNTLKAWTQVHFLIRHSGISKSPPRRAVRRRAPNPVSTLNFSFSLVPRYGATYKFHRTHHQNLYTFASRHICKDNAFHTAY